MLNSKYAPIFALAVLGIVLVLVLGWFFAIKPQFDDARAYSSDEDLVRANIATVSADAAKIEEIKTELEQATPLEPIVELNAPQRLNLVEFRDRMSAAIQDSGVEIIGAEQEFGSFVTGWDIPTVILPTTDLAKHFQSGPAPTTTVTAGAFEPVVRVEAGAVVRTEGMAALPFTFRVVGTYEEVYGFLLNVQEPGQQYFQISEFKADGLIEGEQTSEGAAEAADGDIRLEIVGSLYLSDADLTSLDEGPLGTAELSGDSPFIRLEDDAPEQEGAN